MSVVSSLIVFLHVAFMFTAVAISYGPELLLIIAIRTGRTETVRAVTAVSERSNPAIPVFYFGGGLLGLIAAIKLGLNLLAPWLVIAYVLFGYNMIIGGAVFGRWATGVAKRTSDLPDGPFPPDLALVLRDRRIQILTWIDLAVIIAIVFDMVVKPFS
jgi:hypothetical protein